MLYIFLNNYIQNDTTHNEPIKLAVQGAILYSETDQLNAKVQEEQCFTKLPEETQNPAISKQVYETWLRDCSCAFVKPPTLEECLANTLSIWDSNAPVASLNPSEEDSDWILQWIPTKIHVNAPRFQIYWAPCYKLAYTRIPELNTITNLSIKDGMTKLQEQIELQNPEKIYTITRLKEGIQDHDWPQEMNDTSLPYSDLPPLRFDINSEAQQEKYRRRVRDARIRAKLARYRAERMAQRYEERYGIYPEEDEEEAQTEAEQTEDE